MREGFILGRAILKAKVSHPGWLFSWCYYNHPVMTSLMQKKHLFLFFFSFFRKRNNVTSIFLDKGCHLISFFGMLFSFPCHLILFIKRQTLDLGTACPFWCRSPCWKLCLALHTWEGFLSLAQQALFWLAHGLPRSLALTQLWLEVGSHGWRELTVSTIWVNAFQH